jgi:hypothetical protein
MVEPAGGQSEEILWEQNLMVRATGEKEHNLCAGQPRATRVQGRALGCGLGSHMYHACRYITRTLIAGTTEIRLEVRFGLPDLNELSRCLFGIHKAISSFPSLASLHALEIVARKDPGIIGKLAASLSADLVLRRDFIRLNIVDRLATLDKMMTAKYFANRGQFRKEDLEEIKVELRLATNVLIQIIHQMGHQEVAVAERLRDEMKVAWQDDRKFLRSRRCRVKPCLLRLYERLKALGDIRR